MNGRAINASPGWNVYRARVYNEGRKITLCGLIEKELLKKYTHMSWIRVWQDLNNHVSVSSVSPLAVESNHQQLILCKSVHRDGRAQRHNPMDVRSTFSVVGWQRSETKDGVGNDDPVFVVGYAKHGSFLNARMRLTALSGTPFWRTRHDWPSWRFSVWSLWNRYDPYEPPLFYTSTIHSIRNLDAERKLVKRLRFHD